MPHSTPERDPNTAPADRVPGTSLPPTWCYVDTADPRHLAGWDLDRCPTSLDPRETSRGSIPSDLPHPPSHRSPRQIETDFRHSFWAHRRPRLRSALVSADASPSRLDAWDGCGSCAWVCLHRDDPNAARIVCHRCHDRWCEACAAEKRRRVCRNLTAALVERYQLESPYAKCTRIRFLTLTLRSSDTPLADQINRLYSCFGRFRHRRAIQRCMGGGVQFLELTLNPRTGLWHPHLHVLFEGRYLPHGVARDTWHDVTGDSFVVDIRQLPTIAVAAWYVAKYAAKAVSASVISDHVRLTEAVTALAGRRVFNTFGSFAALGLTDQPEPDAGWYPITTLADLTARAHAGDDEARRILAKLKGVSADEPMDLDPPRVEAAPLPGLQSGPSP